MTFDAENHVDISFEEVKIHLAHKVHDLGYDIL